LKQVALRASNGKPQFAMACGTVRYQLIGNNPDCIGWYREPDADVAAASTQNGCIHPDQFASKIDEGTTRTPEIDCSVRLYEIFVTTIS
jgi:hypothetical protein